MFFFEGDDLVFIYCDWEYYGSDVRFYFEFLFYNFEDVNNIFGRKFDYIFVFDGDMGVFDGCVYELLFIVVVNLEWGIIQLVIKLYCIDKDMIFMYIEFMWQVIYELMINVVMVLFG